MKLNYRYQTDRVPIMIKTRYDNNVTNYTNVVYTENKINLSWPIGSCAIYDESKIGQWCDWS